MCVKVLLKSWGCGYEVVSRRNRHAIDLLGYSRVNNFIWLGFSHSILERMVVMEVLLKITSIVIALPFFAIGAAFQFMGEAVDTGGNFAEDILEKLRNQKGWW